MPRLALHPPTDPALVEQVLARHRARGHVFSPSSSGGKQGVSCFVWVSGKCYSENSLDLCGGVEKELRALPHAFNVYINID